MLQEGPVFNPSRQQAIVGFGKSSSKSSFDKPLFGMVAATLAVSSIITLTPTAASAFNIQGMIVGAIASGLNGGGYRHYSHSNRHAEPHVYAKRDSGSSNKDTDKEKDARDDDTSNAQPISKTTPHPQPGGPVREASQSVQTDAPAKSQDDELTFKPSR